MSGLPESFEECLAHGRKAEDRILRRLMEHGVAWERPSNGAVFTPGRSYPHDGGFDIRLRWLDERVDVKRKTGVDFTGTLDFPFSSVLLGPKRQIDRALNAGLVDWWIWVSRDLRGGIVLSAEHRDQLGIEERDERTGRPHTLGASYSAPLYLFVGLDEWLRQARARQDMAVEQAAGRRSAR